MATITRRIEYMPLSSLTPSPWNPKDHDVGAITTSIQVNAFTNAPVWDERLSCLVIGHGRRKALLALKQDGHDTPDGIQVAPDGEWLVPVQRGWASKDDAHHRRVLLADNQTTILGGWDDAALADTLKLLQQQGELAGSGFDADDLDELLTRLGQGTVAGLTDPDEVPEAPEAAACYVKPGDLWQLGEHRLLCGDSTKAEDVGRVMGGKVADLVFTSPPYGQQRDYGQQISDWFALMAGVFGNLPIADDAQVLVNLGLVHREGEWIPYWEPWIQWMREQGWRRFGWYVWDQGFGLPGNWNGRLGPSHEFVFHFNRQERQARKWVEKDPANVGVRRSKSTMRGKDGETREFSNPEASMQTHKIPDSVIRVTRQAGRIGADLDHPAVFPVGLPKFGIETWLAHGGLVYEPFGGSGTSIIAAEETQRVCCAMELEPRYVQVAIERWQNFTGKTATKLEDHDHAPAATDTPAPTPRTAAKRVSKDRKAAGRIRQKHDRGVRKNRRNV